MFTHRSGGRTYAALGSPERSRSRSRGRSRSPLRRAVSPRDRSQARSRSRSPVGRATVSPRDRSQARSRSRSPVGRATVSPRDRSYTSPGANNRSHWRSGSGSALSPVRARQRADSSPGPRRPSPTQYIQGEKYGARLSPGAIFHLPEDVAQVQLVGLWSTPYPHYRPTARSERYPRDSSVSPLDAELLPHDATGKPLETTRGMQKWVDYTRSLHDEEELPKRLMRTPPRGCPWEWLQAQQLKSMYRQSSTANVAINLSRVPANIRFFSFTLSVRRGQIGSARAPQIQLLERGASGAPETVLCTHVASTLGAAERTAREIVMCRLWRLPDDLESGPEGEMWPTMREASLAERSAGSGYSSPTSVIRQVVGRSVNRIGQQNVAVIDTNRHGTRTPTSHRGARRVGGGWEKVESGAHWVLEILGSDDSDPDLRLSPEDPQPDSDTSDLTWVTDASFDIDDRRPTRIADTWRVTTRHNPRRPVPLQPKSGNDDDDDDDKIHTCELLLMSSFVAMIVVLVLVVASAITYEWPNDATQARKSNSRLAFSQSPAPTPRASLPSPGYKQPATFNASAVWAKTSEEIVGLIDSAEVDLPECLDQRPELVAGVLIFAVCGFILTFCGFLKWLSNYRRQSDLTDKLPRWLQRPSDLQREMEKEKNQADIRRRGYRCCSLCCTVVLLVSIVALYSWYLLGGCVVHQQVDECGLPLLSHRAATQHVVEAPPVIYAFCCPQNDVPDSDGSIISMARSCEFDPQTPDECSEIMAYASGTIELPPYPTWQNIARSGNGQQLCTATQRGGFDRCRYSFEARTPRSTGNASNATESRAAHASRCGFCTGNSPATQQPDIVCDARHAVLVENANMTRGRDVATCCVTTGMCTRNSRPTEEPDIVCPAPKVLRPPGAHHAGWRPGRSVDECCWTRQMCVGNTDGELDITCVAPSVMRPDAHLITARDNQSCCVTHCSTVACPFPSVLRPNAASVEGADASACCITTGMCTSNSDGIAEPDIECSKPSVPRPGLAAHRQGRDESQCCEVTGMCAGNSDAAREPDVVCTAVVQRPIRSVRTPWSMVWRDAVSINGSFARGRSQRQCCECTETSQESIHETAQPMLQGYCFAVGLPGQSMNAALSADNMCTRVMRYAKCLNLTKCREDGERGEQARLSDDCIACAEGPPYPAWHELSESNKAQGPCMGNTVTQRGSAHYIMPSSYSCIYSFQQQMSTPPPPPVTTPNCGLSSSVVGMATEEPASAIQSSSSWTSHG